MAKPGTIPTLTVTFHGSISTIFTFWFLCWSEHARVITLGFEVICIYSFALRRVRCFVEAISMFHATRPVVALCRVAFVTPSSFFTASFPTLVWSNVQTTVFAFWNWWHKDAHVVSFVGEFRRINCFAFGFVRCHVLSIFMNHATRAECTPLRITFRTISRSSVARGPTFIWPYVYIITSFTFCKFWRWSRRWSWWYEHAHMPTCVGKNVVIDCSAFIRVPFIRVALGMFPATSAESALG